MANQLAVRDGGEMDLMTLGNVLAKSGYFADARDAAQAMVKVLAGREMGFGPISSMCGINIIQGRVSLSANIMAAAIKRSGRYNYHVRKMTAEECTIEYFERNGAAWQSIGLSTFTVADAGKAATKNMDKFPRNMLFARAMSNGVRWYCPDVTGAPAYTPEELGANVNEEGEVIDAQPMQPQAPKVTPLANGLTADARADADRAFDELDGETPPPPDQAPASKGQLARIHIAGAKMFTTPERVAEYRAWLKASYGQESSKNLTEAQATDLIERLEAGLKDKSA